MANSTQKYVDNEKSKSFISGILNQEPVGVVQEVDIDLDVEKKISELQEAKLNGKNVNADKELKGRASMDAARELRKIQTSGDPSTATERVAKFLDNLKKQQGG